MNSSRRRLTLLPPRRVEPHLEVASDGRVFVSDTAARVVLEFGSSGELRSRLNETSRKKPLTGPVGLALDEPHGRLYVVESAANSVSTIEVLPATAR